MPYKKKGRGIASAMFNPPEQRKMGATDEYLLFLHCKELEAELKWLIKRFSNSYDPDELEWLSFEAERVEQLIEQICQN